MSDKQQSAVDFLVEHLKEYGFDLSCHTLEINQAKELFKQQIIDAINHELEGCGCGNCDYCADFGNKVETAEQYFNDKFKTESNGKIHNVSL